MRTTNQMQIGILAAILLSAGAAVAKAPKYEVCATKAIIMPAKLSGEAWDSGGKKESPDALRAMAAVAMTGGLAALEGAGSLSSILQGGSGTPDIFLRISFNKKPTIRTSRVFNALNPQWGAKAEHEGCHLKNGEMACNTCAVLTEAQLDDMVDIEVVDEDAFMDDPVGRVTIPKGVPADARAAGLWEVKPFDQVLVLQLSLRAL